MVRFHPHVPRSYSTGILLAVATAVISGFAVFVNGHAVRAWSEVADASAYTTLKNTVAGMILLGITLGRRKRGTASPMSRPSGREWLGLVFVAGVGGAAAFALFFEGLARATSVSAAFIHKTLVFWVAILAVGILRERVRAVHLAAVGLLIAGQAVLAGGVSGLDFGAGEWMILAATLLWSIEVIVAKRLLATLSPTFVANTRIAGGAVLLLAYGAATGSLTALSGVGIHQLGWLAVTGVLLSGYVATWFAALMRAPALDVTSVLVGGALITATLRSGVTGVALPSPAGLALVTLGVALVVAAGAWELEREAR